MNQKNWKQARAFLGGMTVSLLICLCATSALATTVTTTQLSFNEVGVSFNSKGILPKGENLYTESGNAFPSTILYTDENGNGTTYVPIRVLTEALHLDTSWMQSRSQLNVTLSGDQALYLMGTNDAGGEWSGLAKEIDPISPSNGSTLLKQTVEATDDAFQHQFSSLNLENGNCISITVKNNGHFPLQFDLGFQEAGIMVSTPTQVPAGESVTRTVELLSVENLEQQPLTVVIGNAPGAGHTINAEITSTQFPNT